MQLRPENGRACWHGASNGSKLFKFSVRGCCATSGLSGSVPHSIFLAEPASALAQAYSGQWDYAKDEEGRAVVNSDPDNWPIILNWLSFGTVPTNPTESLLSECRYWHLDRLLAAIDARSSSSSRVQAIGDSNRFQRRAGGHRGQPWVCDHWQPSAISLASFLRRQQTTLITSPSMPLAEIGSWTSMKPASYSAMTDWAVTHRCHVQK